MYRARMMMKSLGRVYKDHRSERMTVKNIMIKLK